MPRGGISQGRLHVLGHLEIDFQSQQHSEYLKSLLIEMKLQYRPLPPPGFARERYLMDIIRAAHHHHIITMPSEGEMTTDF